MRVTNAMIAANFLTNIQRGTESLYKTQERIASGKKIGRLSDDPAGLYKLSAIQSALSGKQTYIRSLDSQIAILNEADDALGRAADVLTGARDIAVQAANGSLSESDRALLSGKVEGLINEMAVAGNAMLGDRYIFAGYKINTRPFVPVPENGGLPPPGGGVLYGSVIYCGDGGEIVNEIAPGDLLGLDLNGGRIFGDSGAFDNLDELKNLLAANDMEGIRGQIERLAGNINEIIRYRASAGAKAGRLEDLKGLLIDQQVRLQEQAGILEDTDLAEATVKLNEQKITYESALAAGSRLMQLSLLDFLR